MGKRDKVGDFFLSEKFIYFLVTERKSSSLQKGRDFLNMALPRVTTPSTNAAVVKKNSMFSSANML